ncbi:hypothetical protein RJT34_10295 [Clitoria ternatea]|uniref:Uncharacterized protein n=1 Tax=Clitoria ternatea TaxID=43366 RepID=A0AAN9K7V2_CLITE
MDSSKKDSSSQSPMESSKKDSSSSSQPLPPPPSESVHIISISLEPPLVSNEPNTVHQENVDAGIKKQENDDSVVGVSRHAACRKS